jgi:hypothetical protein
MPLRTLLLQLRESRREEDTLLLSRCMLLRVTVLAVVLVLTPALGEASNFSWSFGKRVGGLNFGVCQR